MSAATGWLRREAAPVSLAVLLHAIVGVLLFVGVGPLASSSRDQPGPGQEHQPIQAVVVSEADYRKAEQSIDAARNARETEVKRLQAQAAAAEQARAQTQRELAQLRAQKDRASSQAAQQQQQLAQLSSRSRQTQESLTEAQTRLKQVQEQTAKLEHERAAAAAALKQQQVAAAAAARKAAEEAKARAEARRKTQLQQELAAEQARQDSRALGNWEAAIQQKVVQNWNKLPSTPPDLDCFIKITQLPSGQVTGAVMQNCNGDQAVQQSIITAVRKASPLPLPADPGVFQREITFEFQPGSSP